MVTNEKNAGVPLGASTELQGESRSKRFYTSPQLLEWGSITELTQGSLLSDFKDFPQKGGTRAT
jgi:hypothetical protein